HRLHQTASRGRSRGHLRAGVGRAGCGTGTADGPDGALHGRDRGGHSPVAGGVGVVARALAPPAERLRGRPPLAVAERSPRAGGVPTGGPWRVSEAHAPLARMLGAGLRAGGLNLYSLPPPWWLPRRRAPHCE